MKILAPPGFYREIRRWCTVDLVYLGAVISVIGGLFWTLSGALSVLLITGILSVSSGFELVTETLSILAVVGTLGGVVALHARQTPYYGLCGSLGFFGACTGSMILLVGVPVSSVLGANTPRTFDLIMGTALWIVACGLLLLGVATLRLGLLPQWSGLTLVLALPLSVVMGDYGGGILFGAIWIAVGCTLLFRHDVSAIVRAGGNHK